MLSMMSLLLYLFTLLWLSFFSLQKRKMKRVMISTTCNRHWLPACVWWCMSTPNLLTKERRKESAMNRKWQKERDVPRLNTCRNASFLPWSNHWSDWVSQTNKTVTLLLPVQSPMDLWLPERNKEGRLHLFSMRTEPDKLDVREWSVSIGERASVHSEVSGGGWMLDFGPPGCDPICRCPDPQGGGHFQSWLLRVCPEGAAAQPPMVEAGWPKAMAPPALFRLIPDICWFIWGRQ